MAGQKHTQFKNGAGFSNIVDNASNPIATAKVPYIRTFWVNLPIVASSSAQAIAYANIPGWPATYARVISAGIDVITAEATGTTKNVSFGYAGATTAFVNAQSAAAIGVIPGAMGLIYQERKALNFDQDKDADTFNAKFLASERYNFDVVDVRCVYGSPGL